MDLKHILLCSNGSSGPGAAAVSNNGNQPFFCLAEGTVKTNTTVVLSQGNSKRRWRVSGMLSIGAVLMLLLMQSSLASDGKTAAAVPPQPVRVHVYSAPKKTKQKTSLSLLENVMNPNTFELL